MELNGLMMAYLGDSIYEYHVRKHLLELGIRHVNKLHKAAIKYTSAVSQSVIILKMLEDDFLTEDEINIFKRGRNSNAKQTKKTCSMIEYKNATGFETLIAFLENDDARLNDILTFSFNVVEGDKHE